MYASHLQDPELYGLATAKNILPKYGSSVSERGSEDNSVKKVACKLHNELLQVDRVAIRATSLNLPKLIQTHGQDPADNVSRHEQ